MKRTVAIAVMAAFAVALGSFALAADTKWPERPVEMICPGNPGGDSDLYQRIFCKYLEKELGQPVVIINMAGAGGSVATNNVHNAKPDGYRGLFFHSGVLVNRLMDFMDYDVWDGFEITGIPAMDRSNCFAISSKAPYKNLKEMVAYAKDHPEEVSFATEVGSYSSLQSLAFEENAGIRFNIVDGGTGSEKLVALLGGRVDVIYSQYSLIKDYIKNGDFICLGVLAKERLKLAPDVPTFKEEGFDLIFDKFFYTSFPKGTPKEIVEKFNLAAKKVAENPNYIAECTRNFVEANYFTPQESVDYIKGQFEFFNTFKPLIDERR